MTDAIDGQFRGAWAIVTDVRASARAFALAKGSYQQDIVQGRESVSGSTLRGAAKAWGARYRRSRDNLFDRFDHAGVEYYVVRSVRRGPGIPSRHYLCLGPIPDGYREVPPRFGYVPRLMTADQRAAHEFAADCSEEVAS